MATLFVAACGGHSGAVPPARHAAATSTPTASPTPAGGASMLPIATVSAAIASVGTYYQTLPHTNLSSDLQSLATHMVTSGQYKTAVVSPGGITATLSDGELTLVYADAPEDVATSSAARIPASLRRPQTQITFSGPPAPHSYVFLFDDADTDFQPQIDSTWGHALQQGSFTNTATQQAIANYSVSAASVSLTNLAGLGTSGYQLDYLSISTHGMVANIAPGGSSTPQYQYYLQSTTPISQRNTYVNDIATKRVALAVDLVNGEGPSTFPVSLAFTPSWLTSNVTFNPGAVVNLAACFGASPLILGDNGVVFINAKVGRWFGWTKAVGIIDDYATWSFALDRLIGEQDPVIDGMDQLATQRVPAQRPFSLDDIYTAMQTETRSTPFQTKNEPYAVSDVSFAPNAAFPPTTDGTAARLVVTDLGYENLAGAPAIYAMPSIATMSIAEAPTNSTLTINGRFPPDEGSVAITDASGQHPLTVSSWKTTQVIATIPSSGNGSAGSVQVFSGTGLAGIASNAAPLTQWSGAITYQESDSLTNMGGVDGTGTGSLTAKFNITFRSDVHPTVPLIDTTPAPQNLAFTNVEDNSTASVTAVQGQFTSSEGTPPPATATISLSQVATLTPKALPLSAGTFIVGAYGTQPIPCNSGVAGPDSGGTTIFCPAFGFYPPFVGVCSPDSDDTGLCGGKETFSPVGSFGAASLTDPGLVTFSMDPSSYTIVVNGPDTQFTRDFGGVGAWPADATVTGTIDSPLYNPTGATTASHRRAGATGRR
ncbi:MAG TPA: hypothetical protein VHT05_11655 [Candidatus Elarobacter sp.]|nr:hypothetical protein [Candidatus Elarobacter sp.]